MAAYAQSPTPADDALALARTLARVDKNGPKAQELKDDYPNRQLQNRLMDRLLDRNDEDLDALFVVARRHGLANIDLFTAYRKLENSDQNNIKDSANYKLLIVASSTKDWIRANRALGFLALYHAKQKDSLPALRFANAALGKIPVNSYNLQIGDARYDTYDVLNTVFIYDRNLTKAVDAAKNMVQYGLQAERDIDRIGVIYNLSVLFAYARDYTTATKLSEMLVNMGSSLSQYENALANLGHGKNLVYQEKYKSALPFLKKARDLSPETIIGVSAKAKLALVYANLGKTNRALGLLREMESVSQQKPAYRERLRPMIDQVYARVYQTKGNYKRAFRYQEKWANAEIAKLENLAFEDRRKASEQLALSEKLARTEFKSLRTKTRLQAEVIVQEKRFRKALTGLLVALLIIILMLIAARIKLKKVNAELEIAAELAKAGEKAKATFLAV
ncbi:MAG TPA: hypothetical protein ENJ42_01635, partial [Hellea balneolensis]|nr:hypothetical protein [Hellea balneolensis]